MNDDKVCDLPSTVSETSLVHYFVFISKVLHLFWVYVQKSSQICLVELKATLLWQASVRNDTQYFQPWVGAHYDLNIRGIF